MPGPGVRHGSWRTLSYAKLLGCPRDESGNARGRTLSTGSDHAGAAGIRSPPRAAGVPAVPRIAPGGRREIGAINVLIAVVIGRATGTAGPPNLFTTLARHRRLYRRWRGFARVLLLQGALPRADTELVILRVAHNCGCEYEWRHHERIALGAGLSPADIARIRQGPRVNGWTPRQAALLRAADELHAKRSLSEETWAQLRPLLRDVQLIELCMLVGHYEMLAMTLCGLAVQPDELSERGSRLGRGAILAGVRRGARRQHVR